MGVSKHSSNAVSARDSSGSWLLIKPIPEEMLSFFAYGLGLEIKVNDKMILFGEIRYVDTFTPGTNIKYVPINFGIVLPFRVF